MSSKKDSPEPARKPLNANQLATLKLVYRFRFVTTDLIARHKNKKRDAVINTHVRILHEQGYIGRRYESSYKLQGKPAAYYLLAKGLAALKQKDKDITGSSKVIYNDRNASEKFIAHSLAVFTVACIFQGLYDDKKKFFAKTELANYDYFPQPMPDGYLSIKDKSKLWHFFVDIYAEATPMFVHIRKLRRYITYDESGEWNVTDSEFPGILVICDTKDLQKRLIARVEGMFEEDAPNLRVLITTMDSLSSSKAGNDRIWADISTDSISPVKLQN